MRFRAVFQMLVSRVLFWVITICMILGVVVSSGQQALVMVLVFSVWASALVSMMGEIILGVGQALIGPVFIGILLGAGHITSVEKRRHKKDEE